MPDYIQKLELELFVVIQELTLTDVKFNQIESIYEKAKMQNPNHPSVKTFVNIAIEYYRQRIVNGKKAGQNTLAYEDALQRYTTVMSKKDKKISSIVEFASSVVKFIVRLPINFLIITNGVIAVSLIICFVLSVCVAGFLKSIMGEKNLTTKASIFSFMKKLNKLLDDIKNEK